MEPETGSEKGIEISGQRKIKVGVEKNQEVSYQFIFKDKHQKVTCTCWSRVVDPALCPLAV